MILADTVMHRPFRQTDIRATLDTKTAQLDTARARLSELEAHLSRRDSMFTEQKRLLKTVKEEYQDRFRALEAKYTAQKAIILRLEEEMLDLYHRSGASGSGNGAVGTGANSGSAQQTPDGDRHSGMYRSIDRVVLVGLDSRFVFIPLFSRRIARSCISTVRIACLQRRHRHESTCHSHRDSEFASVGCCI